MPEGIRCSDAEREQVRSALYAAAGKPSSPQGWRQILAALAAEAAAVRGRRRLVLVLTVLIGLLIAGAIVVGAVHGFGVDGFESHGPEAIEHAHSG
ncbi:hypothetical protein [Amycolatopsis solani]|uniref:hypothetical protein n=1 Tax=Amycolatopsis solani TaxID=3028615 RepID=UPI0025B18ACB|nr:hypothetical protein [Amycolatopsis sp. MEP2-6]